MPIVKVGDKKIKFPDGMSQDEIKTVLQSKFSPRTEDVNAGLQREGIDPNDPNRYAKLFREPQQESTAGAAGRGFIQGAIDDFGAGGAQLLGEIGQKLGFEGADDFLRTIEQARAIRTSAFEQDTEDSPIAATTGRIAGNIAPVVAIPGGVGGKLLTKTATGAATGGALGAAQFVEEGDSRLKNAAIGGVVGGAGTAVVAKTADVFKKSSALKSQVKELIESGSGDNLTAKYILNGAGKVKKDKLAIEAIRQNFDEGVVAAIKGATPKDRAKMLRMVSTLEKGIKNKRFSVTNRPSDVAGGSLADRVKFVRSVNRKAGSQLDGVAKSLKGQQVEFQGPVKTFLQDLSDMGVTFDGQAGKVIFKGSDIEGARGAEGLIRNLINRMRNTQTPDAYDVHRLKRFIDEQVTYGKSAKGLAGKSEGIVKKLRSNLDAVLDESFPQYNRVNTQYSETIQALDSFQSAVGSKIDLSGANADKAIGTVSRRLLGNAQSRVNLLDAIDEVQSVAVSHGGKFDDDLLSQVLFVDELDSVFGSSTRTSLQGDVQKVVDRAARGGFKEGVVSHAIDKAGEVVDNIRGVNEEAALKAIKELLKAK